jgi:hypothetical protein
MLCPRWLRSNIACDVDKADPVTVGAATPANGRLDLT